MMKFALIWILAAYAALAQIEIFNASTKEHLQLFGKYYKLNQKAIDKLNELGCALPANILITSKNDAGFSAYILTQNNQNIGLIAGKKNGIEKISIRTLENKYKERYFADTLLANQTNGFKYGNEAIEIFKRYTGALPTKIKILSKAIVFDNATIPTNDKAIRIEGQGVYMLVFVYGNEIYDKNGVLLSNSSPSMPVEFARISDFFSKSRLHPILKYFRPHEGIDLVAKHGAPVSSVLDGAVEDMGYSPNIGNYVRIRHLDGFESIYGHLSKIRGDLKIGVPLKKKEVIGLVGATGLATGAHLHFGVQQRGKYIDPAIFFATSQQKIADGGFFAFAARTMDILTKNLINGGEQFEY